MSAVSKLLTAAGALALIAAPLAAPTTAAAQGRHFGGGHFAGHFARGGPIGFRSGWGGPGWRGHRGWWGPRFVGYPYFYGGPAYWGPEYGPDYYEAPPPPVIEEAPPPAPAIYEGRAVYPRKVLGYREVVRPRVRRVVHHAVRRHTTIACAVPARHHVSG